MSHWPDEEEIHQTPIFFSICQSCPGSVLDTGQTDACINLLHSTGNQRKQLPVHRSSYFGGHWMRKKGITMKAVHTTSVSREIPIRGNVPAKQTAASGYPRKENICFSRIAVAWEGSGATGGSASHGEDWGGCGYIYVGCFPTYCHYEAGDYPKIFPILNGHEGRCESLWRTHWERGAAAKHCVPSLWSLGRRADGSGSGLILFLTTQKGWPGGGEAGQGQVWRGE